MYIYIYAVSYMWICMHMYFCRSIHPSIHLNLYINMYVYIYMYVYHIYLLIYLFIHMNDVCACTYTYIYTSLLIYICTYTEPVAPVHSQAARQLLPARASRAHGADAPSSKMGGSYIRSVYTYTNIIYICIYMYMYMYVYYVYSYMYMCMYIHIIT